MQQSVGSNLKLYSVSCKLPTVNCLLVLSKGNKIEGKVHFLSRSEVKKLFKLVVTAFKLLSSIELRLSLTSEKMILNYWFGVK